MNNNTLNKVCLFGGALIAAGLTANAHAQEFTIGNSTHNQGIDVGPTVSAYAGSGNYTMNTLVGAAFGPTTIESAFETGTSAQVILNESELTGKVIKEIDSFAYFAFTTSFIPDSDMDVVISWDASTQVPWIDRKFRVWQSLGPTLFEYDVNNGPHNGSITVSLTGGQLYWVDALYRSIHNNGEGSFSIAIPQSACLADLNNDDSLDFVDISNFINMYGLQDPAVDFNGDSEWDFLDVSAFIGAFTKGCP